MARLHLECLSCEYQTFLIVWQVCSLVQEGSGRALEWQGAHPAWSGEFDHSARSVHLELLPTQTMICLAAQLLLTGCHVPQDPPEAWSWEVGCPWCHFWWCLCWSCSSLLSSSPFPPEPATQYRDQHGNHTQDNSQDLAQFRIIFSSCQAGFQDDDHDYDHALTGDWSGKI